MTIHTTAKFSPCRTWRYTLTRRWTFGLPLIAFILLNPSTADEEANDPTITRCIDFAKRWGFGGLIVGNLFAYRATQPRDLYKLFEIDAIGPDNNRWLEWIIDQTNGEVICGWGNHGALYGRDQYVIGMLHFLSGKQRALNITAKGQPSHPLYMPKNAIPFEIVP